MYKVATDWINETMRTLCSYIPSAPIHEGNCPLRSSQFFHDNDQPGPVLSVGASECLTFVQTFMQSGSFLQGLGFYATQLGTTMLADNSSQMAGWTVKLLTAPSHLANSLFVSKKLKDHWAAKLIGPGIALAGYTLLAHQLSVLTPYSPVQGVIYGIHCMAMHVLCFAEEDSILSACYDLFGLRAIGESVDLEKQKALTSLFFITTAYSLTFAFRNSLLANGISYPLTALIHVLATYKFPLNNAKLRML